MICWCEWFWAMLETGSLCRMRFIHLAIIRTHPENECNFMFNFWVMSHREALKDFLYCEQHCTCSQLVAWCCTFKVYVTHIIFFSWFLHISPLNHHDAKTCLHVEACEKNSAFCYGYYSEKRQKKKEIYYVYTYICTFGDVSKKRLLLCTSGI